MATKIIVESHSLDVWFPPDDPMATLIARLCILREDWWIEFNGYTSEDEIKLLDFNSQLYRRLYFLRNLVKTLNEIHETIKGLNSLPEFRSALDAAPPDLKNRFNDGLHYLNKHQRVISTIRNNLGGHVSQNALASVLHERRPQVEVACTFSDDPKHTHFKFAQQLCSLVLFEGILPDKVRLVALDIHLRTEQIICAAFAGYAVARDLMS